MSSPVWFSRLLVALVAFTLCGGPQLVAAQQTAPPSQTQDQTQPATPNTPDQSVGTTQENATPDPTKGPQQPSEKQLPNAPSTSQNTNQQPANTSDQNEGKETPLGAAAAQAGKTTGGTASKPAGTAIAPAKQRQVRSLLIKVGAVAAGAAALGIVYGLSRSSPSIPPGARTTTTTAAAQAAH
jgi:hypothetical protein